MNEELPAILLVAGIFTLDILIIVSVVLKAYVKKLQIRVKKLEDRIKYLENQ